jgi:hypothetical protein
LQTHNSLKVIGVVGNDDKIRVIAYGYSINREGKEDSFTFTAGSETGGYPVYSGAFDWIITKIKGAEYRVVVQ